MCPCPKCLRCCCARVPGLEDNAAMCANAVDYGVCDETDGAGCRAVHAYILAEDAREERQRLLTVEHEAAK